MGPATDELAALGEPAGPFGLVGRPADDRAVAHRVERFLAQLGRVGGAVLAGLLGFDAFLVVLLVAGLLVLGLVGVLVAGLFVAGEGDLVASASRRGLAPALRP